MIHREQSVILEKLSLKSLQNKLYILEVMTKKQPVKIQVTEDKLLLILSLYSGEDYVEPHKKLSKMFYKIYFSKRFVRFSSKHIETVAFIAY